MILTVGATKMNGNMKRICKTFMLVAASALAFSACQKEIENPQEEVKQKTTIHFSAQVKDAETKATLIPEDGDARFVAAWEKDDAMDVWASSGSDYLESGRATWNGTDFDLNLEESDIVGQWEYLGYYPSESSISFGSARTQKGNAYNSLFDVMSGTVSYQEAAFGKDKNNKNVVIPMNRLSTILYFHLTSDLDEAITSATLTVEGGNIAAATAKVSGGALVAEKDATNTITLTFAEGTAPSAKEFQLWFNCLPVTATGLELTVTTATKTATLKNTKGKTYAAGKLNKIVKNGLKWEEKPAEVYTKVTSDDALVDGRYLIVYEEGSVAMNGALDAVSNTIGVKMLNGTIAVSDETLGAEFTFVAAAGSFMDAKGNYIGISSDSNGMDIKSEALKNTVSIDEDGNADVKSSGGAYLRFNAASNQNRFRYYKSSSYTGQKAIQLYAITVVDPTKPSLATTPANGETIEWDNDESGAEKAQTITVKLNEAAKGYTISPSESTADWSITDNEDGTITVYPLAANTSETEDKTLDVTITHKDNASLKSVITLKQTHKGGVKKTATILFGTNNVKINAASVTAKDDQGNTWTITTVGTTSFTANADYYQVGSSKIPAQSITFTTTLPSEVSVSSMSAKFGGFGGTTGTVTLKVGDHSIGTGSLDATKDVTVSSSATARGKDLTVTVTGIDKGVKVYNISVSYVE